MKMNSKLEKAFNEQVAAEIFSAHQYLAMSLQMDTEGLKGFSHWLSKQYSEEMEHAMKMVHYLQERGNQAKVPAISAPPEDYGKPLAVFEAVLAHEKYVTQRILDLYALAEKEKDVSAKIFLNWFVSEQDEEEANANYVVDLLKRAGANPGGLMVINRELGER